MTTSSAASRPPQVVVVGAGPVGLSCALELGRAGIAVRVLEQRSELSDQPRAHVVNARTMELFRAWGIAAQVRAVGLEPKMATSFGWATEMAAEEFAVLDYVDDDTAELYSPERLCSCAQDLVEQRLFAAVRAQPAVQVDFGTEVTGYRSNSRGAVLDVWSIRGGRETIETRYVVAADGASSALRQLGGIGMARSMPLGRRVNIWFDADLRPWSRLRPFILWFIHHVDTQGIFIALDGAERWVYSVEMASDEEFDDYTVERCRNLIRTAVGAPDLNPRIRNIGSWTVDMGVAETFRRGPLFLAGDAAHSFPPMGGFGMNSGIQDAHNLAWKLIHVCTGLARDSLLNTYDLERRPVATFNAEQSMLNAERQQKAAASLTDPGTLALLASSDGSGIRSAAAAGISGLREEFHSLGQQFGHQYAGAGIVDDGSPIRMSTITEYVMSARPGARAPHARLLTSQGRMLSTIDLVTGQWTVLGAGERTAWTAAVRSARNRTALPIEVYCVDSSGTRAAADTESLVDDTAPGYWRDLYELNEGGGVLVRPDGHIGARWKSRPEDIEGEIVAAVQAILGRGAE
ncbi:FAD-dependent monooxygenase [Nocardia gipuzkoensis]